MFNFFQNSRYSFYFIIFKKYFKLLKMRTTALKSFIFLFIFGFITSCSHDKNYEQFPLEQPSNINADDYNVYSVIIKYYNFSEIVIKQKSAFGMSFLGSNNFINELSQENPGFEPEMLTTLFNNNQAPLFFGYSFNSPSTKVVLISESEWNYFFNSDIQNGWIAYHNTHPNVFGYHQLSAVAYNSNKTKALVETGVFCGLLCGQGTLFYLEKVDGLWVIKKTVDTWIS